MALFVQSSSQPGAFLPPTTYKVGQQPIALAVGDLNGDGKLDLAVANGLPVQPHALCNQVSVLLQDAANSGRFLAPVNYPTAYQPYAIAVPAMVAERVFHC